MSYDTVVVGAGPAGLTAGLELVRAGKSRVLIVEADDQVGGLSRTVCHAGNRIDIGGHRFFSKSDWVMDWWRELLPVAAPDSVTNAADIRIGYQGAQRLIGEQAAWARGDDADVMLVRNRLSRIYFGGKLFDYPLKPGLDTALKLGIGKTIGFAASYLRAKLLPVRPETTLQDFFVNRFGTRLYRQFFKEYTEKVWGVPCDRISAAWGAQRVKSLSIGKLFAHALRKLVRRAGGESEQTSLIEHFLYPKLGPGQMWETAADRFRALGGELRLHTQAIGIERDGSRIVAVRLRDAASGVESRVEAAHVISTMPVKDLVAAVEPPLDATARRLASELQYRDFITVGVLYRRMSSKAGVDAVLPDNWIYIQEPGVKVGRVQIFNNWSPHLVADPGTAWVGLEFFAKEDDDLWSMDDAALRQLAIDEMDTIGLAARGDALDSVVIRMPKAYPGYYGEAYDRFDEIRAPLDAIDNLYLVGRNGMHRYNNQDHSMLSAKFAVEAILAGESDKSKLWAVNIDDEYHEEAEAA